MSYPLEKIIGIGPRFQDKLNSAGIKMTRGLLDSTATPEKREELSKKTGISESLILEWANHCDLMRIPGIGPKEADNLEDIGVDTVLELAQRNPENLHENLKRHIETKTPGQWCPDLETVEKWVLYAGNRHLFPRVLEY